LAQLPRQVRQRVLIRTDSGGGTHEFPGLAQPARAAARLLGGVHHHRRRAAGHPQDSRPRVAPAHDAEGEVRPGAWVAEITGMLDPSAWSSGMRVIARKECPHPGAQLRFTDIDGHRFTCFGTSTRGRQLADLIVGR
jgi:hypothetical protein